MACNRLGSGFSAGCLNLLGRGSRCVGLCRDGLHDLGAGWCRDLVLPRAVVRYSYLQWFVCGHLTVLWWGYQCGVIWGCSVFFCRAGQGFWSTCFAGGSPLGVKTSLCAHVAGGVYWLGAGTADESWYPGVGSLSWGEIEYVLRKGVGLFLIFLAAYPVDVGAGE